MSECRNAGRSPSRIRRAGIPGGGLEEALEQRPELAGAPEVLRVPLDAEAETCCGIFDRLDDAVGRGRGDLEAGGYLLDGLVMTAVDLAGIGVAQPLPHEPGQQRVL